MRVTIYNKEQWELHKQEIDKLIEDKKHLNLIYEESHKEKTKAQIGFLFGAIISQLYDYLRYCGFNVDQTDIRYALYEKVSEIVPEMVVDTMLFGGKQRIKHIDEMDRTLMSKFIDGIFQVIDQEPMFAGLQMTPDVMNNWAFHVTNDDIKFASSQEFPERDSSYLDYIREKPCIICGIQHRSEAHHIRDTRTAGMAIKSPDFYTLPLCHKCHMKIAHGVGFKDAISWIPLDLLDFCRIMYLRWRNKNG